jgi:hypothetical protein
VPKDEARDPMLERLDAFVGEWSVEVPFAPGVNGRVVFEWVLGGQFLMERSEVPDVPEAPDGISIIGVDRDGAAYAPDFTPLDFRQRFTGEFSADGRTISGRWETSQDGSTWELDFDLTYRRLT